MGRTSIPVSDETRDMLAESKPESATWDEYLRSLVGESDAVQTNSNELDYDDVRSACESAIDNMLPTERMGR